MKGFISFVLVKNETNLKRACRDSEKYSVVTNMQIIVMFHTFCMTLNQYYFPGVTKFLILLTCFLEVVINR